MEEKMKKKKKVNRIAVVLIILFLLFFSWFFLEFYYDTVRDVLSRKYFEYTYVDEIMFDCDVRDAVEDGLQIPSLISGEAYLCDDCKRLNELLDKSNLSEERKQEILNKAKNVPEGKYLYFCMGRKLKAVYSTEIPYDSCKGVYEDGGNSVYLYYLDGELYNLDGYV